ncbi:FaeA/PapI family transcriptional regulator [Aeromonas veronii]|uniref:FaeA/PapI family transcriptional regulator n=1 Tax=Aeromonas veronii TaxID=654 RepID=UPI0035B94C64
MAYQSVSLFGTTTLYRLSARKVVSDPARGGSHEQDIKHGYHDMSSGVLMVDRRERCLDVLLLLEHKGELTTYQVSHALDISVYQARYYLRRLVRLDMVHEIHMGKGVSSRWITVNQRGAGNDQCVCIKTEFFERMARDTAR